MNLSRRGFLSGVLGSLAGLAAAKIAAVAPAVAKVVPAALQPAFAEAGWWASYAAYHMARGYNFRWKVTAALEDSP